MIPRVSGVLAVDLSRHVDADGCIPAEARLTVGRVLGSAPRGALADVELGHATMVDIDVVRALAAFVPRHPLTIRGSNAAAVSRLVRLLRGESDDLLGGAA